VSSLSEVFRDWLVGDGFARIIARVAGLEVLIAEESRLMEQINQSIGALRAQGGQVAEVAQGLHDLASANHEAFTSIEQQLATLNQQVADLRAGAVDPTAAAHPHGGTDRGHVQAPVWLVADRGYPPLQRVRGSHPDRAPRPTDHRCEWGDLLGRGAGLGSGRRHVRRYPGS
jgi:hypothetical protein